MRTLILFAKAPVPGYAKTRLIPALGEEGAATLAGKLIERTLNTASQLQDADIVLCCAPDCSHECFPQLAETWGVRLQSQVGGDLGQRMTAALDEALQQPGSAVLIGTDCPGLQAGDLETAFAHLEAGCDLVLGRTLDGGYHLIGMKQVYKALFEDMAWSTVEVCGITLQRAQAIGLQVRFTATHQDIDQPEDVQYVADLCV